MEESLVGMGKARGIPKTKRERGGGDDYMEMFTVKVQNKTGYKNRHGYNNLILQILLKAKE